MTGAKNPPRPDGGITVEVDDRRADEAGVPPVDVDRWRRLAAGVLSDEGVPAGAEVGLLFVDEDTMADLNRRHMGAEGPTDVLAFPLDGAGEGGAGTGPGILVGDVVVCVEVARAAAEERGVPVDDELALLVVHGLLHLLGYDHAEDGEAAAMRRRERRHLRQPIGTVR